MRLTAPYQGEVEEGKERKASDKAVRGLREEGASKRVSGEGWGGRKWELGKLHAQGYSQSTCCKEGLEV